MRQLSEANPEKIELINWWWQKQQHNGYDWRVDLQKIEDTIRSGRLSQDQNNWLLVHHHHGAPGLRYMIPKYQTWRETLQGQGCDLILTTVVREPFSRAKSLIHYNHIPEKNFYDFVSRYISQAEYLLFNRAIRLTQFLEPNYLGGPRDPKHLTTTNVVLDNTELTELTGYLQDNFQLVGQTHELDDFIAKSEFLTGFYKLSKRQGKALTKNPSDPRYNFTADMKAFLEPHLTADKILMERLFGN